MEMNGRVSWNQLLESSIQYAKDGFPVTPSQEYWTNVNLDQQDTEFIHLQRFSEFSKVFLKSSGLSYRAGEMMKQPDLAITLEGIASEGSSCLYQGELAKLIAQDVQNHGGLLTEQDFFNHCSDWVDPISVRYRGNQVFNLPPNTQGFAALSILNILNHFDLSLTEEGSRITIICLWKQRNERLKTAITI
jgi:oxamate amidohydrolase